MGESYGGSRGGHIVCGIAPTTSGLEWDGQNL